MKFVWKSYKVLRTLMPRVSLFCLDVSWLVVAAWSASLYRDSRLSSVVSVLAVGGGATGLRALGGATGLRATVGATGLCALNGATRLRGGATGLRAGCGAGTAGVLSDAKSFNSA